jgi:TonB family protein
MGVLQRGASGVAGLILFAASTMSGQSNLTLGIYPTVRCDSPVASAPMRLDNLSAPICLEPTPILTETELTSAAASYGRDGKPTVELTLSGSAAQRFHDFTSRSIGLKVGVVLNGRLVSVAMIAAPTAALSLQGLTPDQANAAVNAFRNGAVSPSPPPPLRPGGTGTAGGYAGTARGGAGFSPPSVIHKVEPEYTDAARAAGTQGTVILNILIHEDGSAEVVRVARSLDPGLDEKAVECAHKYRFKPAMRDGMPISARATLEINFRL